MRKLRGRAASPIRPGLIIKRVLLGRLPLATGEYVTEAAISDLHGAYWQRVKAENHLRDRQHLLRGMNIHSFTTLFKFARYLGLVNHVRNEPRRFNFGGSLYRAENGTGLHIVESPRRTIFRLSDKGRTDDISWLDLRRAWVEWRATQPNLPTTQPMARPKA